MHLYKWAWFVLQSKMGKMFRVCSGWKICSFSFSSELCTILWCAIKPQWNTLMFVIVMCQNGEKKKNRVVWILLWSTVHWQSCKQMTYYLDEDETEHSVPATVFHVICYHCSVQNMWMSVSVSQSEYQELTHITKTMWWLTLTRLRNNQPDDCDQPQIKVRIISWLIWIH